MQLFIMRRDAKTSDHLVQTMKKYIANDCRLVGRDMVPLPGWAQAGAYFL
jgi:hypothetical protein